MQESNIEWTTYTWNPWRGCHKVSAGCKNCYAETLVNRYKKVWKQDFREIRRGTPAVFNKPLHIKKPSMVFTCSMSDFFIEQADAWRPEAWEIIRRTPHITYQILTKRPERIIECLPHDWHGGWLNVWLGTSVEDQEQASIRIPQLLKVPARLRFLSMEPLIGPVKFVHPKIACMDSNIDWIIIGGESGPGARPCDITWIMSLVLECQYNYADVFVKQLGTHLAKQFGLHGKASDPSLWPAQLNIIKQREIPAIQ
jgi:protein gp37